MLLQEWAAGLHPDLQLTFTSGSQGEREGLYVHNYRVELVYLRTAFRKAERFVPGLGYQLLDVLGCTALGFNPIWTPSNLYWNNVWRNWYESETDEELREALKEEYFADSDEPRADGELPFPGPQQFIDDMDGMPADAINPKLGNHKSSTLWSSGKLRALAAGGCPPAMRELLLAMAQCVEFKDAGYPMAGRIDNQAEWENADVCYFVRWSPKDQLDKWLDNMIQEQWEDGLGTDAILVFEPDWPTVGRNGKKRRTLVELEAAFDNVVAFIEGASMHIWCMDQLCCAIGAVKGK